MILGQLKGWAASLPPEADTAEVVVLASTGEPHSVPGVALAQRRTDGALIFAALGPGQRICGEWTPLSALDERTAAQASLPPRQPHAGLMMFMRGFVYGAAGSGFTGEQMADPDWKKGWDAGRASKQAAYIEGCLAYNTELDPLRAAGEGQ